MFTHDFSIELLLIVLDLLFLQAVFMAYIAIQSRREELQKAEAQKRNKIKL